MGLGRYLVHELGFDDQRDTLGRWMAHHVAALINEAEKGSTAAARLTARKTANETILKIWEHRTLLPGRAYPLAPYKDLLNVLDLLRPDNNPFRYGNRRLETKREQLAADLFDSLSRLIIALLLMKLLTSKNKGKRDTVVKKALTKTERDVLMALERWQGIFIPQPRSTKSTHKSMRGPSAKVELVEVALTLIENIAKVLPQIRKEIAHKPPTSENR